MNMNFIHAIFCIIRPVPDVLILVYYFLRSYIFISGSGFEFTQTAVA